MPDNYLTKNNWLIKAVLVLLLLTLFFWGIYHAASFLKPLSVAFLVALLMLPVSRKAEAKGINRLWSSVISTLIVTTFIIFIIGLVGYQANQISSDSDELEKKGKEQLKKLEKQVTKTTGLTSEQIQSYLKKTGATKLQNTAENISSGIMNSLMDLLLMLIYTYLFLYYRRHFKKFILKITTDGKKEEARKTMEETSALALHYLGGRFMLIAILAVCYGTGLTLLGVKFGIFYGILGALLSLIPYIGNVIALALPLLTATIYGSPTTIIGVLILFAVVQFIESYLLEPLIVGKKVNIHPMMTILVVVLGGILWGVPGMIIAIPYLGILVILFSKLKALEPVAFLLSDDS
ncbi:hypothetical protein C900_00207 [Fulvivirga imtechensis AK7]|uniref:AI-2E family transporter n=1 Tax=Fulvivirga imtechensis AK7 TaxID=1237149 RepID=L8JM51_9BACT|nr:AI-2E family transporter [Fulvivirga imtechensis]ELR68604.1 hypothetical protein C900_00207 [Fulvivirga imtechensis AK7]